MDISGQVRRETSADPRAQRTNKALKQALMQLLQHGDWEEITVAGICRRAGVARSSFYEHFDAKADLLDVIFADLMREIRPSSRAGDPFGTLDWLVNHVAEAPKFFAKAMSGGRGDALLPRFRAALTRKLEEELRARSVGESGPKAAYLVGGSMAYLAEAKGGANSATLQQMAARVLRQT